MCKIYYNNMHIFVLVFYFGALSKIGNILTILYNNSEHIIYNIHATSASEIPLGIWYRRFNNPPGNAREIVTIRCRSPCLLIGLHTRACPRARICFSVRAFSDTITTIIVKRENNSHLAGEFEVTLISQYHRTLYIYM